MPQSLPLNFSQKAKTLDALIHMCWLHIGDGPVNLEKAFEFLNIGLDGGPQVSGFHGAALISRDEDISNYKVLINKAESTAMQRKTQGHELAHLINHVTTKNRACFSYEGQCYSSEEFEADCISAYLLVPIGNLLYAARESWTGVQLAAALDVPLELVNLRFRIALELDELNSQR